MGHCALFHLTGASRPGHCRASANSRTPTDDRAVMNDYDPTIRSASAAAARLVQAWAAVLTRRLEEGTAADRLAATLLLRDLANGELRELPASMRTAIASRMKVCLATEPHPAVRDVM